MQLQADTLSITRAGREIQTLSDGLQRTMHAASDVLIRAEGAVGDGPLGLALRDLGQSLVRAEHQSARAISAFGRQVQLAAHAYRQADLDLARNIRREV